jgi:hypothetical protein
MGQMMYSYVRSPQGANLPRLYIIDPAGFIRADSEYSLLSHDLFETKGLFAEIDRLLKK